MNDDDQIKLESCFYDFVITDPYPEISQWEQFQAMRNDVSKFFYLGNRPRPEISAHKAWQDGFNFAKALVIKRIEEIRK